jgi:rSAM/selenodomain-associated transferase 1
VPAKLIILFAKSPAPGRVKTRLFPVLRPDLAAELHSAFVLDMIHRFRHVEHTDFELHTDTCSDAWASLGVTRNVQISGDLGLKMVHSLRHGLDAGWSRVIIIGSDAPTLPMDYVRQLLDASSDVALGPANDGGFYAISASRIHPAMFDTVSWSQPDTLIQTVAAIQRCDLSVELGAEWYDVDEPADLDKLMVEPDLPLHTAACIRRIRVLRDSG